MVNSYSNIHDCFSYDFNKVNPMDFFHGIIKANKIYNRSDNMDEFNKNDLCLFREWYNELQDLKPDYFDEEDIQLYKKLQNILKELE